MIRACSEERDSSLVETKARRRAFEGNCETFNFLPGAGLRKDATKKKAFCTAGAEEVKAEGRQVKRETTGTGADGKKWPQLPKMFPRKTGASVAEGTAVVAVNSSSC